MSTSGRKWMLWACVGGLLALHAFIALRAVSGKSVTVDEIFHVTGGYFYNRFGDYRIHPDNGVLPQRLHALPAVLAGAKPPVLEGNIYWRTSDVYVMSYQFFYESGNDHWPMLMRARTLNLIFSLGLLLLVYVWAYRLAGPVAGFVALMLGAFSPTVLAHGALATTDMAAAFFLTTSAGAFGWQLQRGGWPRICLSAVVFGLACVSKFSAVLLLPGFALLTGCHWLTAPVDKRRPVHTFAVLAIHGLAGLAVIWACFGFRYSAFAPGVPPADHFITRWDWLLSHAGWQGGPLRWLRDHKIFPEAFIFGYSHTYVGSLSRAAYLAGEYSETGWKSFFPSAFLWKSSLSEIAGLLLGLVCVGQRWRRITVWLPRLLPLLVLTGVYGVVALFSHLNIGHRHLLPLYPTLFIAIGIAVARPGISSRLKSIVMTVLIAAQLGEAGVNFPHYLAYFNALAGGPTNGWRLLVDSSLDWGQDLPGLKAWLNRHNAGPAAQPVFLSYFGSGEPHYYGIEAHRMLFGNGFKLRSVWYEPTAGLYCVSATMLSEVYSQARGPWTLEYEKQYQDLRRLDAQFRSYLQDPGARTHLLLFASADQWERAWQRFETLRHARLCAYLRMRRPVATIGHSIFIYQLTGDEVDRALNRSHNDWLELLATSPR